MPELSDFPPDVQAYFKANGIDPRQLVPVDNATQTSPTEGMSKTAAAGATLKAHAGGILGGGAATLAGIALAPETGGLSLAIPIAAGLAGSYGGQRLQQAVLPDDVQQRIQQEGEQATKEHPWVTLGTDVAASALASGGKPSTGAIRRALSGDLGALRNVALQAGLNTAIDTGVQSASAGKLQLPTGRDLVGDIAGGALFSEPSSLGRMAHRTSSEPFIETYPNQTVQTPALTQNEIGPLRMAPVTPTEVSPSATSETGLVPKTKDTVTQNKMEDTTVSPTNPIDKKNQTIGPSGLTKAEEDALKGIDVRDIDTSKPTVPEVTTKLQGDIPEKFVTQKYSDEDFATYNEANERLKSLTTPEKVGSPEWAQAFADFESIRNKYGGMPPEQKVIPPKEEAPVNEEQPISIAPEQKAKLQEAVKPTTESTKVIPSETKIEQNPYKAGTWAVIDKVHDLNHPGARPLADAAKQALNERDRLVGQWKNPIVEAGNKLSSADKKLLNQVKDAELTTGKPQSGMLSGASKELKNYYALAKKLYSDNGDYRIASGEPVYSGGLPRPLKKDPSYWAGMPDQKVEQVYRDNVDQTAISKLDKIFDDWNQKKLGMTPAGSAKVIESFKTAVRGNRGSSDISHQDYFNASRRAMGQPLPPEFREQDPVKNDARYFDRQSIDNAHYRFMEKNPEAMAALGEKNDAWGKPITHSYPEGSLTGNEQVKRLISQFRPDITSNAEHTQSAVGSLVTNLLINGPALEMHKIVSNQVGAIGQADDPYQLSRAIGHALTHLNEGWQHAKEGGLVKLSASSSLDMFNGTLNAAQRLNGLSKVVRDISTLGGLTTKLNAGLMQSYFESLVPSKIIRANRGDIDAQRFLKRLDPTYTVGKIYNGPDTIQLASQAAQYIHGTGDIRTMPSWMMRDNEIKGFLELAHWSVSQTTKFQHDIWEPMKRGNYTPLMTGMFGATIGGYIIKQLREELSGKKSPIPSLTEIANSERGLAGNGGPLMYNAIAAMQYAGFGGLISQIAKYPFDVVYKNKPQGATFPLDQIAEDLAVTTGQVASAIANDPNVNYVDLAKSVAMHVLQSDIQLSRTAINQGIDTGLIHGLPAEKKMLSDKMNELRRFDIVNGLPYNDIEQSANPFMNIEQQKFKHDPDIVESAQMIPGLINNIIQRYGSNPDVMFSKIKALKENVYSTMPSLESTPIQFFRYLQYLGRTEGPEKAQAMLQDYMTRTIGNKIKSGIVP
jgi:hypothetical protein